MDENELLRANRMRDDGGQGPAGADGELRYDGNDGVAAGDGEDDITEEVAEEDLEEGWGAAGDSEE